MATPTLIRVSDSWFPTPAVRTHLATEPLDQNPAPRLRSPTLPQKPVHLFPNEPSRGRLSSAEKGCRPAAHNDPGRRTSVWEPPGRSCCPGRTLGLKENRGQHSLLVWTDCCRVPGRPDTGPTVSAASARDRRSHRQFRRPAHSAT